MPSEPRFDRCQFDPAMHGKVTHAIQSFRQHSIFGEEGYDLAEGFLNIVSERRSVRPDSAMFADKEIVKLILLAAFPNLADSKPQRKHARHWLKVIRLYWHVGAPVSHIARESGKTVKAIERTVEEIRKKAKQCTDGQ